MAEPRILFAGTPEFSVPPLRALLDGGYQVVGVYTQPDRPAGRGRKLQPGPVKRLAQERDVPVFQPRNFRDPAEVETLRGLRPDLMVVVAYGLILPRAVLDAPVRGCVNIHASLLPRWRGAAPIQRAVLAGDSETGITIMEMEEGLDTGPMLLKKATPIAPDETGGSLHDRLSLLGAEALMEALPGILDGSLVAEPQDDGLACYAAKLDKAEAEIDWRRPAAELDRQVRAFDPWPVAQTRYRDQVMRVWQARPLEGTVDAAPGTVVATGREGMDVATGDGLLRITRLQLPGKKAMETSAFLNAHDPLGVVLG